MIVETGDAEYWRDRFLYMQELYKRSAEANEKLRQALEQPEPEPVGYADQHDLDRAGHDFWIGRPKVWISRQQGKNTVTLYTAPPKREWVGLTDADIGEVGIGNVEGERMLPYAFARAIEAKLKELNHD